MLKVKNKHKKNKKQKQKQNIERLVCYKSTFLKLLFFLFYIIFNIKILSKSNNNINNNNNINYNKTNNNINNTYFTCYIAMAKLENRYARELVEYYISLGVEKFYLGDDNLLNTEKLSDVLQDYIDSGIVEIKETGQGNWTHHDYFEYMLKKHKDECKWMFFYDMDEYLYFVDKHMTLKKYLSLDMFNKCDVIKIDWLMYYDNDLVYYDNRPLKERFTKPDYNTYENHNHKSLVRGKDYNGVMWSLGTGPHQPNESLVNMCNSDGALSNVRHGVMSPPTYTHCYLKHYSLKTAEEYAIRVRRGNFQNTQFDINERFERFFQYNKFTKEKLDIIEKIMNRTFPQLHKKYLPNN